jgi:predicted permease
MTFEGKRGGGRGKPPRRAFRPDHATEVDDELAFHLEMRAAELEARGVSASAARELALARFGDLAATRADCLDIARRKERRMARSEYFTDFLQDLQFGLRSLRRRPGFAAVAILTLALGIGATSAVFTIFDAVLLRPLPYPEADRLVRVHHVDREEWVLDGAFSPPDFEDFAPAADRFAALAPYFSEPGQSGVNLRGDQAPVRLRSAYVSAPFFPTLGIGPRLGRVFQPADLVPGKDRSLVISSRLWEGRFGADPATVGRKVDVDGEPFTIVGVMPSRFAFPEPDVDVWLPLSLIGEDDIPRRRFLRWMQVVGRLRPDVTPAAAQAQLDGLLAGLARAHPNSNEGWTESRVVPLLDSLVGGVRPALRILFGAVGLVLLIACANYANLLLARGTQRLRELGIRSALGAERRRLVRQLLTESLVLAVLGGAAGLALAYGGLAALRGMALEQLPRAQSISLDLRMIAFTFAVALVSSLVFGLAPALRGARLAAAATRGARGASERRGGLRSVLVVAETALAVLLLVGAGLLLRSLWTLTHTDPGFQPDGVLAVSLSYHGEIPPAERLQRHRELLDRVAAVPGVVGVGASKTLPLHGGGEPYSFHLPGRPDEEVRPAGGAVIVSPGYFRTLGIPVHAGREFSFADGDEGAPLGFVVNLALARQLWSDGQALGKSLMLGDFEGTVIGVVGDVHVDGLAADAPPTLYVGTHMAPRSSVKLYVRTAGDPVALAPAVRAAVAEAEPDLPIAELATLPEVIARTVVAPRFFATLLGLFSALALSLALVGLYGVLSFSVAQATREIGIRLALGAGRGTVVALVVGRTARLAGLGLVLGIAAAIAGGKVLAGQLHGVAPRDPATLAGVVVVLGAGALVAAWLPARRAAAVEPALSMRE